MIVTSKLAGLFMLFLVFSLGTIAQTTLIPFGATWKYLDNGSDQGTTWRGIFFNDDTWKSGPAELGYGDGDEASLVSYGFDPANKYITTYFRKTISIVDASLYRDYTLTFKRDDGAVVYINGAEVFRTNLPTGTITYTTLATNATNDGNPPVTTTLPAGALKSGTNVIAVEVHQKSHSSSDLSFNLGITGNTDTINQTAPAVMNINRYSPDTESTSATEVVFRTTFSEAVTGVDTADFALRGTASATIASVNGTGNTYDIAVNNTNGTGTLGLDLKSSGTGIEDAAGNAIGSGFTNGQTYNITTDEPATDITLIRGPYLQMVSTTAMTLRWRTDVATDSKVEVGTSYGNYSITATSAAVTTEHEVRVTGLTTDTKYYYRYGSSSKMLQEGTDNVFVTAPPATTLKKIRIAAFGDCGSASTVQKQVLNAYLDFVEDNPADLMLLLGDNAYQDGTDDEYQNKFFTPYGSTILKNHALFPTPGNHDYHTTLKTARDAPYYKNFSLPTKAESGGIASGTEAYYSYDWGNIHFISLDSYGEDSSDNSRLYDTLGPQVTWVKKDLAANNSKWTIVYWHHPPFTKGSHNSDTEGELIRIRENFISILERYGVDLVLCGHSHNYERSYLLKGYYGTESTFDPDVHAASTSSGMYNGSTNSCPYVIANDQIQHGTVYVVSGSSARNGATVASTFPHDALPFATTDGGMFYFEVEDNRLDAKFIRQDGVVYDQFTIMKGSNNTSNLSVVADAPITLTASWIGNYKWSNGATTKSITVTPDRDVKITVTDNNNCLKDVFNINVATTLAATTKSGYKQRELDKSTGSIQVFPSVVKRGSAVTITSNTTEEVNANIVDNYGRLIQSLKFKGTTSFATSNLAKGMYFILVKDKNKIKTNKLIVTD